MAHMELREYDGTNKVNPKGKVMRLVCKGTSKRWGRRPKAINIKVATVAEGWEKALEWYSRSYCSPADVKALLYVGGGPALRYKFKDQVGVRMDPASEEVLKDSEGHDVVLFKASEYNATKAKMDTWDGRQANLNAAYEAATQEYAALVANTLWSALGAYPSVGSNIANQLKDKHTSFTVWADNGNSSYHPTRLEFQINWVGVPTISLHTLSFSETMDVARMTPTWKEYLDNVQAMADVYDMLATIMDSGPVKALQDAVDCAKVERDAHNRTDI